MRDLTGLQEAVDKACATMDRLGQQNTVLLKALREAEMLLDEGAFHGAQDVLRAAV